MIKYVYRPAGFVWCSYFELLGCLEVSFHTKTTTLVIRLRSFKVSLQWQSSVGDSNLEENVIRVFNKGWLHLFPDTLRVFPQTSLHRDFDRTPAVPSLAGAECCDLWHFAPWMALFDSPIHYVNQAVRRKNTFEKWIVMISNLLDGIIPHHYCNQKGFWTLLTWGIRPL